MDNYLEILVRDFLDILEGQEAKLLTWGFVDGGFSEDEIYDQAETFLDEISSDEDPDDLVEEMIERRLLFEINIGGRKVWRTRMAESVRLLARLRQIFQNQKWQIAPTLVADFRFALRPRTYPRRHISPDNVLLSLEDLNLPSFKKEMLLSMLKSAGREGFLLSDFQMRSTWRMLADIGAKYSRGMIVCAGTGTGKTLAFYLPALTHVSNEVERNSYWTKAVAIYPRNELLKDQFSETYAEARRIDGKLRPKAGRKLIIGAFFGAAPRYCSPEEFKYKGWAPHRDGFICPYLLCPKCGGTLAWQKKDIQSKTERLHCTRQGCGAIVREDEVILTRQRMAASPPDILFATTETLNRNLSDSKYQHVFGVGSKRRPQIVLLDEVHTYAGIHGAQVALLLRRWRHAVGTKMHFTGLSATLQDAREFFSQLVGLGPSHIEEIGAGDDLVQEGMEYLLALRGDPVSATSLLSTSIQAAMLLRRILEPGDEMPAQGLYGRRVFIFTDDLDVTNRLFHNIQDAEGLDSRGNQLPSKKPLASLRSRGAAENARRMTAGQSWHLCEEIGHPEGLGVPLKIGRTSSQDIGVDKKSDVIVATATLEVGFNDPEVGAVLQHKAPHSMASFLQRKGRAGRNKKMRPWTIVVLSDYGRDRLAYQGYDILFNPVIERRALPVSNRYVLKMQAVFALIDWIAAQLPEDCPKGSIWIDLSGPPLVLYKQESVKNDIRKRQAAEAKIIRRLLEDRNYAQNIEAYLEKALKVVTEEAKVLLWEPPRPIMTAVLPTILRRLETSWLTFNSRGGEGDLEYHQRFIPLPEFIPPNLFSDLNLPEVNIITPPEFKGKEHGQHPMPILQALNTFAPGRVTRRFGIGHASISHWVSPEKLDVARQDLAIEKFCKDYKEMGTFQLWEDEKPTDIRCIRPWALHVTKPPHNVLITSNAQLQWHSQIMPGGDGVEADLPIGSKWSDLINEIKFYSHNNRHNVTVRRFATGSKMNLRFKGGGELESNLRYIQGDSGKPVSIGFLQEVDGIAIRFRVPKEFNISPSDANQQKVRSFRTAYLRHRILNDPRLDGLANLFQRDWLFQIFCSAIVSNALIKNISLCDSHADLASGDLSGEMAKVLNTIFQVISNDQQAQEGQEEQGEESETHRQKVHDTLADFCRSSKVLEVLNDLARILWEDPDEGWKNWATLRLKSTLGTALLQAASQVSSQFDSGDLLLDIESGPRSPYMPTFPDGIEELWITETTSGGGGMVEEIFRRYNEDPRRFFRLAESALGPSDFELVDSELSNLLDLAAADDSIKSAFAAVRSADGFKELQQATGNLKNILNSGGILLTHPVLSAINTRILRAGSSPQSDTLIRTMIQMWKQEEERLGVEIDARVFAYVGSTSHHLDHALAHIGQAQLDDLNWRFQVIYGLLWPRGSLVRSQGLSTYNPFAPLPDPDREILKDILIIDDNVIMLEDQNWRDKVVGALAQFGTARIYAPVSKREDLKKNIQDLMVEPMEIGFLNLYPRIESLQRDKDGYYATLDIREAIQ